MKHLINELLRLRHRPYIITECFLCLFLVFMVVLSGPRFGKFATLSGGMVVLSYAVEAFLRNEVSLVIEKILPMIPYVLFVVLSLLLLPLIPYASSRAWNNGTGVAILIATFLLIRRYGHVKLLGYAFPLAVIGICFFVFVAPSLIGAEGSTGRLNNRVNYTSSLTGGGQNASSLSVIVGIAYFMAIRGILLKPVKFRNLFDVENMMYLLAMLVGFYLIVVRSGSRQGLVWILLAAMFCYAVYTRRQVILGLFFSIPIATVGLAMTFFLFYETATIQRIVAIFDPVARTFDPEKSVELRSEMLAIGFELWQQSPIWGHGNEAFRVKAGLGGYYSHNNYIELLCNYGMIGITLFYLPLVIALVLSVQGFFKHQHDMLKIDYLWIVFAIFALLANHMFMPSYYMKHVLVFMGIILGRLYYLRDNETRILSQRPMSQPPRRVY